jgi:peptide/nickel transport system permease protein
VWGARVSLVAGAATAAAAMLIGVVLGVFGGYYTGWSETVIMRLTDILMAFPYILLAIAIVAGLGPGLRNAMIAITIVGFPIYTRLVRGIVLSVREREFVEAARALGSTDRLILVRHIVPQLSRRSSWPSASTSVRRSSRRRGSLPWPRHPAAHGRLGQHAGDGRQFVILSPHVVLLPGLASS